MVMTYADTFDTFQDAVDAPLAMHECLLLIGGFPTEFAEITTQHRVRQPVGTATILLPPMDLPEHVTVGATVQIQAGYPGVTATIFQGILPKQSITWSDDGRVATLSCVGYGTWFARRDYVTVSFPGPVSGKTLYQSLASRRGIPFAWADDMLTPDGSSVIEFGGNADYDGGEVVIQRKTSSAQWSNQLFNLFGYFAFDIPSGPNRFQRVSGVPTVSPVATYVEGETGYRYAMETDLDDVVTYWEVKGARYTEASTGLNVEVRSIPAVVPSNPLLGPDEYTRDERSHNQLVTDALAEIVRNVHEIDYSELTQTVTWQDEGSPHIQPGDVVHVTAPSIMVDADLWVMSVTHRINDRDGFTTDFEGWAGGGEPLAAGENCVTQTIGAGPYHRGDEYISWYAVPTPTSAPLVLPFVAADDYSSMAVICLAHGANSFMRSGKNADSTVSKFEVWQNGEKIGEGQLQVLDENYEKRYPYGTSDSYWTELTIPITGSIEAGPAEVRLIPGRDTRLPWATGLDDFEVKNVRIRTCGVGQPILPNEVTT